MAGNGGVVNIPLMACLRAFKAPFILKIHLSKAGSLPGTVSHYARCSLSAYRCFCFATADDLARDVR